MFILLSKAKTVLYLWPRRTTTPLATRSWLQRTPMILMKNRVSHVTGELLSPKVVLEIHFAYSSFSVACLLRADPAKWGHQLELSLPGWHGQWSMRLPVQRGFFLLPLQQGGSEGLRVHRPVPKHARVHAEVPRALPTRGRERSANPSSLWLGLSRCFHVPRLCRLFWKWLCLLSFKFCGCCPVRQHVTWRQLDCQLRSVIIPSPSVTT